MPIKQVSGNNTEVDEKLAALLTNSSAIQAIASAVEGTIGPKGLDTMLVDRFGDVTITNAGVTILDKMEVSHPAARMLINTARAQQEEIGDGTTTATIMAGSMVAEGVNQVVRGVPIARVIDGLRAGVQGALKVLEARARPIQTLDDPILRRIAYIAGRERGDIADLVVEAARLVGTDKLREESFKLSETIIAKEGAANEVFLGVIVDKERLNKQMPRQVEPARVLILDDALEPEKLEEEALSTDTGFARYLAIKQEFQQNVARIISLGVNLVLVDRGVDDLAEEMLADAGVMVLSRVSHRELRQAAEHTGARMVKRTALRKSPEELQKYLGHAARAYEDEKLDHLRILGGQGKPMATVLVGAATAEVVDERERITRDAASSVQAAVRGGYLPGGGASELWVSHELEALRGEMHGMSGYGVDCVREALRRPFSQIVQNAGFNPLEKLEQVQNAQVLSGKDSLATDCDTGEVADMIELGVVDPAPVKRHALKAAGEVAEAILRINTIIKKRDEGGGQAPSTAGGSGQP
jgi:chaperonin GroEL (HSP60 family)